MRGTHGACLDAPGEVRAAFGPQDHLTAIAILCGAGIYACIRGHSDCASLVQITCALPVAADQYSASARGTAGVDQCSVAHPHLLTGGGHLAALGGSRRHVYRAGDAGLPIARIQTDHAPVVAQAAGFQRAAVVDHRALQAVDGLSRQNNQATGRMYRPSVLHQSGNGRRADRDVGQAGALQLQAVGLTRGQSHGTELCDDHAVVSDLGREQGDIAAQRGGQVAFVDHAAGSAVATETIFSGHEVGNRHRVRGGDQAADIGAGARRKVDAVGVGKKHLTIGIEAAIYLAGVAV